MIHSLTFLRILAQNFPKCGKKGPEAFTISANLVLSCHCLCALFHEPFEESELISYSFHNH